MIQTLTLSLVVVFSFAMLSMGIVQNVEARGADEPCSYLKPHEWTRDSSGNCVRISSVPVTSSPPVTGRSVHEPCSYLNPTKYVRDSSGLCHEVVVSAPTPQTTTAVTTETFVTPQYQSTTGITSGGDSGIISTLLMMLGPAAIGIVLSKKLRGRKRTVRSERSTTRTISDELPGWGWREIRDFENRFRTMRDEDPDQILVEAGAKLKNFSKRGNELYEAKRIIRNRTLKILKYVDPSTGRIYISFVPDHINDADEAMAWKFNITKQEYQNLVDEG
tara:strand:- start:604 stop:1431 length:828 start_codon:yes stop_codon:yes gene_type:complete